MSNSISSLIESRSSTGRYDANQLIADAQVEELVRLATRAPSAFNAQNWKFIAVRSTDAKARLKAVSFGQQQVEDASVTFIVCGTLDVHKTLPAALQPSVDAGILNQSTFDTWISMTRATHQDNPQLQRDEAFRSASLATMTLMLAAQGMGFASGAMSGFDADGVVQEFGLNRNEVPVMLVTVGYPADGNWPQKPRKPVEDVLEIA